jgi:predicted tellurium resistance membrane protein TerC
MLPLLFILIVIGLSMLVSCLLSEKITWFTYYIGIMSGLLISGIVLEFSNRRRRKREQELREKSKKPFF